jgi:hypothetical protein
VTLDGSLVTVQHHSDRQNGGDARADQSHGQEDQRDDGDEDDHG